jgi:hypothetical protein
MERAVRGEPHSGGTLWIALVAELVDSNLQQWELEDKTRDPGAGDPEVADAKRQIDRLNMGRHRLVEKIDAAIDSAINQSAAAPVATESPGMVLDRLSVLVIRRARMKKVASQDRYYSERVPALDRRLATLSAAYDFYMDELLAGTRRFLPYEHLKIYGSSPSESA